MEKQLAFSELTQSHWQTGPANTEQGLVEEEGLKQTGNTNFQNATNCALQSSFTSSCLGSIITLQFASKAIEIFEDAFV